MAYASPKRKLRADEYIRMGELGIIGPEERVELLNGEIYEMPPIGDGHNSGVLGLNYVLNRRLSGRATVGAQGPIRLDDYSEPEPDIVVLQFRENFYRARKPLPEEVLLLIEVSDTTLDYDRREKLPRYARAGLAEVWLVNLVERCIEVYHDPVGDSFASHTVHARGDTLTLLAFPDVSITVAEILG